MRQESERVLAELTDDVRGWDNARAALATALGVRDACDRRKARRVLDATGGLGSRRWEADARRRGVATAAEALRYARAMRAAPAVQAAIDEQNRSLEDADRAVTVACAAVATAAAALVTYGPIGAKAAGVTLFELTRLAGALPRAEGIAVGEERSRA
jgi:hypothetical protein